MMRPRPAPAQEVYGKLEEPDGLAGLLRLRVSGPRLQDQARAPAPRARLSGGREASANKPCRCAGCAARQDSARLPGRPQPLAPAGSRRRTGGPSGSPWERSQHPYTTLS